MTTHGGPRPGAGAPSGNLNALKSGKYSAQLDAAVRAMLANDEFRPILLAIIRKRRRDAARFQALVLASAKLIHRAELSPAIMSKLVDYLESEIALRRPGQNAKNN